MSETYVTVTGNVATQPVLRVGRTGTPFLTFRLAQNVNRLDRTTGVVETIATNWMTVCAFRAHAVNLYRSLAKGQPVIVHGRLRVQDWATDERSGTTVELEATAVGHDLARGQACFVKVAQPPLPQSTDTAADRRQLRELAASAAREAAPEVLPVFIPPEPASEEQAEHSEQSVSAVDSEPGRAPV